MSSNSNKVTILQILPALESGGVERGVIDIAKALKENDFEPIVASSGGVMTYQLNEAKIKHIDLKLNTKNPFKIFLNIRKIKKIISENKIDIIHVRSRAPMISAYFAVKKTSAKLVSTVHGNYSTKFFFFKKFYLKILYNSVMLRSERVIAVSGFIKNYILENYQKLFKEDLSKKISIIQRGVDIKYFNSNSISINLQIEWAKKWSLPEDKKIILFPARITEWKGHEFLFKSLAKVKSDFFCVCVGSNHGHKKFHTKLEKIIKDENLEGKVKFVGNCNNMPAAYALSNIVISASTRAEAFGRIAIEAQAMKKIIIATNIGGSLETIKNNETGFLVEPNNYNQMAQAIEDALSLSKERYDEIVNMARLNIEHNFSNQKMCDSTIEIYKSIIH